MAKDILKFVNFVNDESFDTSMELLSAKLTKRVIVVMKINRDSPRF